MTILAALAPGLIEAGSRLLDRLIPDPSERQQAKLLLLHAPGRQRRHSLRFNRVMGHVSLRDDRNSGVDPQRQFTTVCYRASQSPLDLICARPRPPLWEQAVEPVPQFVFDQRFAAHSQKRLRHSLVSGRFKGLHILYYPEPAYANQGALERLYRVP